MVTGANRRIALSGEDKFDTMRELAISSWANSKKYIRIQLGLSTDFQEQSKS
jgi:hypothetical protein